MTKWTVLTNFLLLLLTLIRLPAQERHPVEFPSVSVPDPGGRISADLLRHPINEKARQLLQTALKTMNSGDHEAAIRQLLAVLAKYPESAPYVYSMIGVEYMRTERYEDAVDSFEQAVVLLPHDAVNRYNLGLSLVCTGDVRKGVVEVRRAIEMDPSNPTMHAFLDALTKAKLIPAETAQSETQP